MCAGARNGFTRIVGAIALWAVSAGAIGCGYTSKYSPPADGRARPLWRDNKVEVDLAAVPSEECMNEVSRVTGIGRLELGPSREVFLPASSGGYWVPRYYGAPIVVLTPRLAPPLGVRPVFTPVTIPAPGATKGFVTTGGGFGGGKMSLGGGGDLGKGLVVLAVIALVVLPAIDLGLALADPEDAKASSSTIDQVNVYNDLARWPGSPCAYAMAPPMPMAPAPEGGTP